MLQRVMFLALLFFISSAEVSGVVHGWSVVLEVVWEIGDIKMGMGWYLVHIAWE